MEHPESRLGSNSWAKLIGVVANAITGVAAVVALVLELWPNPPETLRAEFLSVQIEPDVSLRDWDAREEAAEFPVDHEIYSSDSPGVVARFRIKIEGFLGSPIAINWTLLRATDRKNVSEAMTGVELGALEAEADEDTATWDAWVPLPGAGLVGSYVLRMEAEDDDGVILHHLDSEPFPRDRLLSS